MKPRSLRVYIRLLVLLPWLLFGAADIWHMLVDDFGQLEKAQHERMQLLSAPLLEVLHGQEPMQPDERLLNALKRNSDIHSVTLVNSDYRVLSHVGEPLGPHLNPKDFPRDIATLMAEPIPGTPNLSLYVTPILNPHSDHLLQGWLLLATQQDALAKSKQNLIVRMMIYQTLVLLFALGIIAIAQRLALAPIDHLSQKLALINEGALETRITPSIALEMNTLAEQVTELAKKMTQMQIDMKLEIRQTTEDLRETLETIEIQNVELDLARKQAVLANRTKSEFLANMSHEIRTPLNGIVGFTNLLLKSPLKSRQKEHLLTIKKSSEILLMIINDILDFSKIEAGKLSLERTAIDLRELIEDVISMLAPTAHAKNLELVHLHYHDVPPEIMGDPLRIKQVLTNLINNAIKFTHSGEVIVRVMLEENEPDNAESSRIVRDLIRISVSDTGVGLSRAQQSSIFQAFTQADATTARNYGGTGLGLSISQKLIELMDGRIGFESELGLGSTFWFSLPVELPSIHSAQEVQDALTGLKIRCLEPHPASRIALEHLLQLWRTDYHFAHSIDTLLQPHNSKNAAEINIICLSRSELQHAASRAAIRELVNHDQKVVLVTPTLDQYEQEVIRLATLHLVKPITRQRFYDALRELTCEQEIASPTSDANHPHDALIDNTYPVLVVDDNEINLALMLSLLESVGLMADGANDGYQAIERCRSRSYAIIFMDIQMPGMDGIETMHRIRQLNRHYQHTLIIALTAYALPEEREKFLRQGFRTLITKPIDEDKLRDVLNRYLHPALRESTPVLQMAQPKTRAQHEQTVDLREQLALCNHNQTLAGELLHKLLGLLPQDQALIARLLTEQKWDELEQSVHKLHGATHYCGVPRLRAAARQAEHDLKRQLPTAAATLQRLLAEISAILDWAGKHRDDWPLALAQMAQTPTQE